MESCVGNRRVVALEGPCCAGKTTLMGNLIAAIGQSKIETVRDYSDFVGGGKNLPPPVPRSLNEEASHLNIFLEIEKKRTSHLSDTENTVDYVIIDRSIHTLIAHCCGIENTTKLPITELAFSVLSRSPIPVWPDLIVYLDIPTTVARVRGVKKFAADSIFLNREYNSGIKEYFLDRIERKKIDIMWLDATGDPQVLKHSVYDGISKVVADDHGISTTVI